MSKEQPSQILFRAEMLEEKTLVTGAYDGECRIVKKHNGFPFFSGSSVTKYSYELIKQKTLEISFDYGKTWRNPNVIKMALIDHDRKLKKQNGREPLVKS